MTDETEGTMGRTTINDRVTGEDLEQEKDRTKREYGELTEKEKQIQASFWAQNFLIAELATANRLLRNLLIEKGIFTQKEDNKLADDIISKDILRAMYDNTEKAFYDKYQRVRFVMDNPQEVEEHMARMEQEGENKNG